MPATLDKEMDAAVRKALIDEAAAAAVQAVLDTPEGKDMIDRLAKDKAVATLRLLVGKSVSESEVSNVETALAAPGDGKR